MDPDVQVLLYFGGTKTARELKRGDILISHDMKTKVVMSHATVNSNENYMIFPETSSSFVVAKESLISLIDKTTNETIEITAKDCFDQYLNRKFALYSIPVKYAQSQTKNDPYLIGMLIGGNASTKSFNSIYKDYLMKRLDNIQRGVFEERSKNDLTQADQDEIRNILTNRFIPDEYLYNSEQIRLKLLQGIISGSKTNSRARSRSTSPGRDTTRRIVRSKSMSRVDKVRGRSKIPVLKKNMTAITIYDQNLSYQIVFLAKSLGYNVVYDEDNREITIFGNISNNVVPINAEITKVPFKIKKLMNSPQKELIHVGFGADASNDYRVILSSCLVFAL